MVQQQLVEYVSSQIKSGVSKEAIRLALLGAGWPMADVDDSMKKAEGGASAPAQMPAAVSPAGPAVVSVSGMGSGNAGSASKPMDTQPKKMSDLVAQKGSSTTASAMSSGASPATMPANQSKPVSMDTAAGMRGGMKKEGGASLSGSAMAGGAMNMKPNTMNTANMNQKPMDGHKAPVIIMSVVIILLALLAGFFYWQNMNLSAKVDSMTGANGSQATAKNANLDALNAKVAALTAQNQDLMTNLSFFAAPSATSTPSQSISITGLISGGGKDPYTLTTKYGVKILIANSKDAKVSAFLAPLVGTSTTLSATYFPGSRAMSVVAPASASVPAPQPSK